MNLMLFVMVKIMISVPPNSKIGDDQLKKKNQFSKETIGNLYFIAALNFLVTDVLHYKDEIKFLNMYM